MEDNIIDNSELEVYFNNDALESYMQEVNKYPLLSRDEFLKYFEEYKNGNIESHEKLINSNLRLVASIAFQNKNKIKHLHILDIIQEGNLGLMRAIETYNPEIASFSTYATQCIQRAISKAIVDKEDEIRKPNYIQFKIYRYKKLIDKNNKLGIEMTDEEIIKELDLTLEELKNIKIAVSQKVTSMNKKIDDDESNELGDFLTSDNDDYNNIENEIVNKELIAVLKEILTPADFYVIFSRILSSKSVTLESIGKEFNVTKERVRQIETRALNQIRPYIDKKNNSFRKVLNKINSLGKIIDNVKISAITPDDICVHKYMYKYFTKLENKVYELKYLNDYNLSDIDICVRCNITKNELLNIIKNINFKFNNYFNMEEYKKFKNTLIKAYGKKIYTLDNNVQIVDYRDLDEISDNLSETEIKL